MPPLIIKKAPPAKAAPAPVKKVAASTAKKASASPAAASTTRRPAQGADRSVLRGWSGGREIRESTSDFAEEFRPEKDVTYIIKFLEEEPFGNFKQHWIERTGKRSFTCMGVDCPLCGLGDKPSGRYGFNVLVLSENEPVVRAWFVGPREFNSLEKKASDPKQGPLPRHYWTVLKTGKAGQAKTEIAMTKARDLDEDWPEVIVPDDSELGTYTLYDDTIIQRYNKKQLQEIADEQTEE